MCLWQPMPQVGGGGHLGLQDQGHKTVNADLIWKCLSLSNTHAKY